MIKFNYYIPTRIVFGCGSLEQLATLKLPGKKALIVIKEVSQEIRISKYSLKMAA